MQKLNELFAYNPEAAAGIELGSERVSRLDMLLTGG